MSPALRYNVLRVDSARLTKQFSSQADCFIACDTVAAVHSRSCSWISGRAELGRAASPRLRTTLATEQRERVAFCAYERAARRRTGRFSLAVPRRGPPCSVCASLAPPGAAARGFIIDTSASPRRKDERNVFTAASNPTSEWLSHRRAGPDQSKTNKPGDRNCTVIKRLAFSLFKSSLARWLAATLRIDAAVHE